MRDIEFQYIYKGLPFSHSDSGFSLIKKVYSLSQIQRGISKVCDMHNICELLAIRQYTGLKDKNGVKIFERDRAYCAGEYMGHVVYENGAFRIEDGDSRQSNAPLNQERAIKLEFRVPESFS